MKTLRRQHGATLFMSMIMLIILTLLALSTFNVSQTNLQVVSNMQQRDAALFAARSVLEEVLSGTRFQDSPAKTLLAQTGCGGVNQRCVDLNGDGTNDVTVSLTQPPSCVNVKNIKTASLNLDVPDEARCSVGATQTPGVEGAEPPSLCADSVWEVQAQATDAVSEATVTVTQGIAVMSSADLVKSNCP